jgi:flagellar biosynthesis protein FlhG
VVASTHTAACSHTNVPRSVAVVGAKGGVGRSVIALNLAVAAGQGRRVLLLDATLSGGDLATLAGVEAPAGLLRGGEPRVSRVTDGVDLAVLSTSPGDDITAGLQAANMGWEKAYDWIVADTGTGIDGPALASARVADDVLLVVAPEMPAVADGYATLKAIRGHRPALRADCIVNMAESASEAEGVYDGLADLARSFLRAEIDNQGYIPFNRHVRVAAKSQTPFVLAFPSSPAAAAITRIATQLTERSSPLRQPNEGAFLEGTLRSLVEYPPQECLEPLQEVWATP